MATFEVRTPIVGPPSAVFDLARDIDAHTRSQAQANERAVGGVTSGKIELGQSVTRRATHFGVKTLRHRHLFEPSDDETVMIDRVSFTAPFEAEVPSPAS